MHVHAVRLINRPFRHISLETPSFEKGPKRPRGKMNELISSLYRCDSLDKITPLYFLSLSLSLSPLIYSKVDMNRLLFVDEGVLVKGGCKVKQVDGNDILK